MSISKDLLIIVDSCRKLDNCGILHRITLDVHLKNIRLNRPSAVDHVIAATTACYLVPGVPPFVGLLYAVVSQDMIRFILLLYGSSFLGLSILLFSLYHGKIWAFRRLRMLFSLSLLSMVISMLIMPNRILMFNWSGLCNVLTFSGMLFSYLQLNRDEVARYFLMCRYEKLFRFISALNIHQPSTVRRSTPFCIENNLAETATNPL